MAAGILKIKTAIPPVKADIVSRELLLDELSRGLQIKDGFGRPLTLISAPAGYGKTTLVREWLAVWHRTGCWLSVDESDNEYTRFWQYIICSLQNVEQKLADKTLKILLDNPAPDLDRGPDDFLLHLLNELMNLQSPVILVVDDYHLIHNAQIHAQMTFLIENMPPMLHLVVNTRSDPPWPLSRWRAKDLLAEIRQENLQFTQQEAKSFLNSQLVIDLNDGQIETLHRKTEGWVAGLKLAGISLAADAEPLTLIDRINGSSRHIVQFLTDEVLSRLGENLQEFLLHTAVLDRLCGSLCDAVSGRAGSEVVLMELERTNMFIVPLDSENIWFRYHQLFADVLLHRLKKTRPEIIPDLYVRASRWFLQAGEPGQAARMALLGSNIEMAGEIFHDHYDEIIKSDGPELLYGSFHRFPIELKRKFPLLMAHMALYQLIHQGLTQAGAYIEQADKLSYNDEKKNRDYMGIVAAVKAYACIFRNDYRQAIDLAGRAGAMLPPDSYYWRMNTAIYAGDANLFMGNPRQAYPHYLQAQVFSNKIGNPVLCLNTGFKTATSLYFMGRLDEAEKMNRELLVTARSNGLAGIPRAGLLWTLLGELLRAKGRLTEAKTHIERGIVYSEAEKPCLGWNYLFLAAIHYSCGEYTEAYQAIAHIELLNSEYGLPLFVNIPAAVWRAKLLLRTGQPDAALKCLEKIGIRLEESPEPGKEAGYIVLAQCLLASRIENAGLLSVLLEIVSGQTLSRGNLAVHIEAQLIRARLAIASGQPGEAKLLAKTALAVGEKAGLKQIFSDNRHDLDNVFAKIKGENQVRSTDFNIVANEDKSVFRQPSELVEKLSEREMEILDLICQGLSNQEISDQLYLTLGTVKWHASNIYGKLGVRSRTQAIQARGRMGEN